jgi:hypothetical protein
VMDMGDSWRTQGWSLSRDPAWKLVYTAWALPLA